MKLGSLRTAFVALLALAAVLAAAPGRAEAGTPKDQLIVGVNMLNLLTLDPQNSTHPGMQFIITNMYDYLIHTDPTNVNNLVPGIAESWEEREDGTIVFHVRKGVTFHSGNPLTADDVVYTLRRAVKAGLQSTSFFRSWGYDADNIDSKVNKTDDFTVVWEPVLKVTPKLKLLLLARQLGGVMDSKLLIANEKDGDFGKAWATTGDAGSGPYKMTSWLPNDRAVLTRFDEYWGDKAKLNRIVMLHLPESQMVRMQLEKGDIDLAFDLTSSDLEALSTNDAVDVLRIPGAGWWYFAMCLNDPDFADAHLRKAIRHAIDYKSINETILKYYGNQSKSFIPEGVAGHDPELVGNDYNLDLAKEEMAKSGYKPGAPKQLLALNYAPYTDLAVIIQDNLAKIGIPVEVRTGNGEQVYGPMRNRDFQFQVGTSGLTGPGDPDAWVRFIMYNPDNSDAAGLNNLQAWNHKIQIPELNVLVEEAGSILDENRRAELYEEAVKIYEDFGPTFIPVARRVQPYAVSKRVKNLVIDPTFTTRANKAEKE